MFRISHPDGAAIIDVNQEYEIEPAIRASDPGR
jgi:hypothetical protein